MTVSVLINIDVADLERGIAFYCNAFDLGVSRRLGSGVVELAGACAPIYLLQKEAGSDAAPQVDAAVAISAPQAALRRSYVRHWTPVHLDFVVDDIERALTRALDAGAVQEGPITDNVWGKLVLLSDPFGNGLCLIEFVGSGYGEIVQELDPSLPASRTGFSEAS